MASEQQVPIATGIDGVSFLALSFEHRHLTAEVRHRKLPLNYGQWFPSILAANDLANSVTPDPSLAISVSLLSITDCIWTNSPEKHGSFFNLFATICLKTTISITHEILSLPHLSSH